MNRFSWCEAYTVGRIKHFIHIYTKDEIIASDIYIHGSKIATIGKFDKWEKRIINGIEIIIPIFKFYDSKYEQKQKELQEFATTELDEYKQKISALKG